MDAQNAADSFQTKPLVGASNHRDQPASSTKPPLSASTVRVDSKDHETNDSVSDADDRDSDAETIVLPGKDGHSPSKVRKVRQEDRSDGDRETINGTRHTDLRNHEGAHNGARLVTSGGSRIGLPGEPRKRQVSASLDKRRDTLSRTKDSSSGLTSAPTSPPQNRRRRQSATSHSSQSDTDRQMSRGTSLRDKVNSGERFVPSKRKSHRDDSEDEETTRKFRRQRLSASGQDTTRAIRDSKSNASKHDPRNRSSSPPPRSHRRSTSQLSSQPQNGLLKKRRVPAPILTDNFSDDSSASGSPHPRHTRTKSLATPASNDLAMSPAKAMHSHKKHLDAHGQTYLARACARGEYDSAKTRLGERPEDLNVADYAGNTPLQIAAIHGCEDIVKLLVQAGCNLDCVNYDKDTPLLDAVDNGHLGVVKLLLDAGVNPRKANVNGEEPIDRVTEDMDNAEEIRNALIEAKKRFGGRTKTSEERNLHLDYSETRDSNAPESPRRSPALATATNPLSRRAGTVRSTKTRNDLLYMPLDEKTLRQAAGRGDEETVARVLQVKDGCDDAESMVAAARGGHEPVIQLLLGLGGAQADPEPVASQPQEFATPMLAAIGQENIKVLELLLNQQGFDPTKRFKGETYYELARRRRGTNWKEEEEMLKKAYDAYKTSNKSKLKSPGRRDRDRDRDDKRNRREDRGETRTLKHSNSSPPRDTEPGKKGYALKLSSPREKRKSESHTTVTANEENLQKMGLVRQKKDERYASTNASDRELSPSAIHKPLKAKRTESDVAAMSSEGEAVKPRRKLVSKGALRGEREKQRRSSVASNASSFRDPSSPHEARHDDTADRLKLSEKYHDRAKALKRDESRDRLGSSTDAPAKRHRNSLTPDRPSNTGKDDGEGPLKRRRLESGNPEKRQKHASTSDGQRRNSSSAPDHAKSSSKSIPKKEFLDSRGKSHEKSSHQKDPAHEADNEPSVRIKSEDRDVEMPDIEAQKAAASTTRHADAEEERKKRKVAQQAQEDEERKRIEQEERKQADEKKKKRRLEEEEARKREEEKRQAVEQRKKEEAARFKREEEDAQDKLRLAEEKARLEAEEKAKREVAEREAAEKQRLEEEKRKAEEELARQAEEEKRKREREAQEEARRKQEEEEERQQRERAQKEEAERKQAAREAAREAELKRIREEQDRIRLEKLPPLLRWLDIAENPKASSVVEGLRVIQGVRYDCIRPEANRTAEGREQWVLNTHVALLLGEKDLNLSRCESSSFLNLVCVLW